MKFLGRQRAWSVDALKPREGGVLSLVLGLQNSGRVARRTAVFAAPMELGRAW